MSDADQPGPRPAPAARPRGLRVLLADDSEETVILLSRMIREAGHEVLGVAADGQDALDRARATLPDVLLLDIMMPRLHGIEVLKALQADARTRRIAVLMCSSRNFPADIQQAREYGATDFLTKPFRRARVVEAVNAVALRLSERDAAAGERAVTPAPSSAPATATPTAPASTSSSRVEATPSSSAPPPAATPTPPTPAPASPSAPAADYCPTLDLSRGYLKLWGTRGSIPVSRRQIARHGGNTSCMEVRPAAGAPASAPQAPAPPLGLPPHITTDARDLIIFDAGTGIRDLGAALVAPGAAKPSTIHLFIGHTHWDHIQGFPFFAPAYIPGVNLKVYGGAGFRKDLRSIFQGQLDRDYFPVELSAMAASMEFLALRDNPVRIAGLDIHWTFANHPGATVCFKFATGGGGGWRPRTVGYLSDNEFLQGYLGRPHEVAPDSPLLEPHRALIDFFTGCDLMIAEAQYLAEDYRKKIGWGHTSVTNACLLMKLCGIKRWIVTHHDPIEDDEALHYKLALIRQVLADLGHPIPVELAYDGLTEPF